MTPLKSIEEEKEDCIQAFKDNPESTLAWTCHHEILIETLTQPYQKRIDYILTGKPKEEQATRLRNFRPVRIKLPDPVNEVLKAYDEALKVHNKAWKAFDEASKARNDELTKLHNEDWPDNSWNGRSIFNE